jgi:starvation-inducible DNA-binding protein
MSEILFVTRIAIPENVIEDLTDILNVQLANSIVAQQMIKFAHWNVKGAGFFPAHKLFDRVYEEVVEATDRLGERITALGGVAEGLPRQVSDFNTMTPYAFGPTALVQEHIEGVANVVAELGNGLRKLAGNVNANGTTTLEEETSRRDLVTQNMLLDITEQLDKQLYFLEAHLRP